MNLILFYAKVQNFSLSLSFYMHFTIIQIQFFCMLLVWPSLTFITASILLQGDFGPMPEKKLILGSHVIYYHKHSDQRAAVANHTPFHQTYD